jgi:hypothetical protein
VLVLAPALTLALAPRAPAQGQRVEVRVPAAVRGTPLTGRVYIFVTRHADIEPRLQVRHESDCTPFFGVDVTALASGSPAVIDAGTLGYPVASLKEIPAGDYYVQALANVYTQFRRADGHLLWLHDDQWEGQQFNKSPGNLVSEVLRLHLDPARTDTIRLELTRALPPIELPPDTRWVKHIKIQSAILTAWWGRPMYVGATVLLPRGYEADTARRYPTVYEQGHFTLNPPFDFSTDSSVETPAARAARLARTAREPDFEFSKAWTAPGFPQLIAVTFQHPTPYFDDSYAVNSANNGPYGDALLTELVPYLETHFRMIRAPWARALTGGSTGGWEALALQVYHPDFFGGTWVLYPDPVDFRNYEIPDIYSDTNAFVHPVAEWMSYDVPAEVEVNGQVRISVRMESQYEAVLGSHARSGEQFAIWEATYGPAARDGYPAELWDLGTGTIDHAVAAYFKAHDYDLRDYLERNWATLAPALAGQLHVYVGDMDTFYLNLAVYRLADFLKRAQPPADAEIGYGRPMKPHGWQPWTNAELLRIMARHMERHRPRR